MKHVSARLISGRASDRTHRSPQQSWALAFLAGLLVAGSASCSKPSPGVLELQRSRLAVRAAQSWQKDVSVQMPSGQWSIVTLEKVECPARLDRTSITHDQHASSAHEIWFDGLYYKMESTGSWTAADVPLPANCGQGPSLVPDGILYDDLDAVARNGEVRQGQPAQSDPESCTWWEVALAKGAPAHYSVCVDNTDHLPRTVRFHEQNLTYVYTLSRWNATSLKLPPDIAVPSN